MANYYVQEILKQAITPKYQEYFEYSEADKEIYFRHSIIDMFNYSNVDIFDAAFLVLIEQCNGAAVICYDFFFNEKGHVDCIDVHIPDDELTIELIQAAMDKAIDVIKQTVIKYKKYKQELLVKQLEEI